jgi:hypothetical protein
MEKYSAQIVNTGGIGELEHPAIQTIESLKIFQFSQIKFVEENGETKQVTLNDKELGQTEIQHILNTLSHKVDISFDENGNVTLHF